MSWGFTVTGGPEELKLGTWRESRLPTLRSGVPGASAMPGGRRCGRSASGCGLAPRCAPVVARFGCQLRVGRRRGGHGPGRRCPPRRWEPGGVEEQSPGFVGSLVKPGGSRSWGLAVLHPIAWVAAPWNPLQEIAGSWHNVHNSLGSMAQLPPISATLDQERPAMHR